MKQTLIILGRFPKVGNVKTRLAKDIGEKKAVLFYKNCAENIFLEIEKLDNTKLFFYYADFKNKLEIKNWVGKKFECIDPKFSDIEKNLHYAFSNCFKLGFEKVVSVATDVPQLSTKIIDQAFKALDKNDVVIGPDNDGGFYLFGVKKFYPNLFNFKYLDKFITGQQI